MCEKVVEWNMSLFHAIPDWFISHKQLKELDNYDLDEHIAWYYDYKHHKAQKTHMKKELIPVTWHTFRLWSLRMPKDEKKETKKKLWNDKYKVGIRYIRSKKFSFNGFKNI